LERLCQVAVFMGGGAVGFYSRDIRFITHDMKLLSPTIVPAVPRLLNRTYDAVVEKLMKRSRFRRWLFNLGLKMKTNQLNMGVVRGNTIWDKLLFQKIRQEFGGDARLMVVGSAPMAANVLTFMRAALGCVVLEGYGQTECTGCCTLTVQGDSLPGHVGPPLPCSAVKLADVPELEYFASSNQGEICIRGSNVFMGYFRDPEQTRLVIDEQGWLHTGDIGQWTDSGTLQIIDRKKPCFKLCQGQYISPDKIEKIFRRSPFIAQAFVHGDSLKSSIVAIIVPEIGAIREWAGKRSIPNQSFTWLCSNKDIRNLISEEIKRVAGETQRKYYEIPKEIYLHPDLFSEHNGLLTSDRKHLRRKTLEKYFKPQLDDMYMNID